MKNKILIVLISLLTLFVVTGCNESTNGGNNYSGGNSKPDHKIYKYIKASSSNGSSLLIPIEYIIGNPRVVEHADDKQDPCLIIEHDTETGKAKKVTFYTFFLDTKPDTEWSDIALENYNSSSDSYKKNLSNVKTGRVNDFVTYLKADITVDSYIYDQYIEMLVKKQDIDKYKDEVFFSRLYNYSNEPEHKEGNNFFEDALSGIRIEWSDSEIKAY